MTDLEKFKALFENINIMYGVTTYKETGETMIVIDEAHIDEHGYGKCLDIYFNADGSFKEFDTYGE